MSLFRRAALVLGILLLLLVYTSSQRFFERVPRPAPTEEMYVAVPGWVQVLMAGGDRYLAADLGFIRAVVSSTGKLEPGTHAVLGKIQRDVAFLNPAHEDNYYIAAATLPWNGQLEAGQDVLRHAMAARPYDVYPAFFYGFNEWYFRKDIVSATTAFRSAALRTNNEDDRTNMTVLAANFAQRHDDPMMARQIMLAMAAQTRYKELKEHLLQRAERLRLLAELRQARQDYVGRTGQPLRQLDDLIRAGVLKQLPKDPLGIGFELDAAGIPQLKKI